MIEDVQLKGLWWIPGTEDTKLAGTLSIKKGKPSLELIGSFGHERLSEADRYETFSDGLAEHSRIFGFTSDGRDVTLEGHTSAPYTASMPGMEMATYRRELAVVGLTIEQGEEIEFDEIAIRASDLNEWTGVSGWKRHVDFEERPDGGQGFVGFQIGFEAPDEITIPLAHGAEAALRFAVKGRGLIGQPTSQIDFRQIASLHLRFPRAIGTKRLYKLVVQSRNFLSLAVGRPVSVLSVHGYRGTGTERKEAALYWPIAYNPELPEKRRMRHEMLFALPEVQPDISAALKRWYAKQARLEPVFNLFFGVRHHPILPLEVRFLSYAQAVETYDSRRSAGQPKLKENMASVLSDCATVAREIVGKGEDRDKFIEKFTNTRHYYTHYNPRRRADAAEGLELFVLIAQLEAIIEMLLLRELGFGCRAIKALLTRARRFEAIRLARRQAAAS